jgi:hypothetical protein
MAMVVLKKINKMYMDFNEITWHDSIIKEVIIDRRLPGYNDTIKLIIEWVDIGNGVLIFEEVYWASLNFNFGIIADETIMHAFAVSSNDSDLSLLYEKWKGAINNVKLNAYTIQLNSSGSQIKIIAKDFRKG